MIMATPQTTRVSCNSTEIPKVFGRPCTIQNCAVDRGCSILDHLHNAGHVLTGMFRTKLTFLLYILYWLLQGWYIVTYALAIYLLNQFIGFLSPKFDPEMEEALMEDGEISYNYCCYVIP